MIYETKSIFKISLHAGCPATAFDSLGPSLTLALMRCPYDAVGSLPRLVIVERCTALAVVTRRVVSAHTLAMDLQSKHGWTFFFPPCCQLTTSVIIEPAISLPVSI